MTNIYFLNKQITARFLAAVTIVSLLMSALPVAFFVALAQEVARPTQDSQKTIVEIDVTGNTAAGENLVGWMFNRDTTTDTPIAFNTSEASLGVGSLNVLPVGATAADKFVGEYFWVEDIDNLESFSYDFKIGAGGVATQEEQFYLNVYANFVGSSPTKFYDCRYDVVPTVGSVGGFTTVTFDPTQAYPVTTRGGNNPSPHACPAVPADMDTVGGEGSVIRAFALNLGDTSTSDVGLDGYFDKVVLNEVDKVTTFDFEPARPVDPPTPNPVCEMGENLIKNGSFEAETVTANSGQWQIFSSVSNWIIGLSDGLEIWKNFNGTGVGVAADGTNNVELDGNNATSITQTAATVPGAIYELKYKYSARAGTAQADSKMEAKVNGVVVFTSNTDGSAATGNVWQDRTYTFPASGASTQIEFVDAGVANDGGGYGPLLDKVSLCMVKAAPEVPPSCKLEINSDTTTVVMDSNTLAVATYNAHPSWTAVIPGATWIWDTVQVVNPLADTTRTFVETFTVDSPTNASLTIAADNGYQVYLNNVLVADAIGIEDNYRVSEQDTIPLTLASGANTLKVVVKNFALAGSTYETNPAGLLFKLTADGTTNCKRTTVPEVPPTTSTVTMCKFDEQNMPLAGWQLALLGEKERELSVLPNGTVQQMAAVPVGGYVLKASGTYDYGNGNLQSDARFSKRNPSEAIHTGPYVPWVNTNTFPVGVQNYLSLQVNNDGAATWGTVYSPSHIYYGSLNQATAGPVDFKIVDDNYGDNTNSLTVELFKGKTGITNQNGCVVFNDVPYGNYEVEELLQTGWMNLSGLVEVEVDSRTETFNVVNKDISTVPPEQCTLEMNSDEGTVVVERNGYAVNTYVHENWTDDIPVARWIWNTFLADEIDNGEDQTFTFKETFTVNNPTLADLDIAADNDYEININGGAVEYPFSYQGDDSHFSDLGKDDLDIKSFLVSGNNVIEIKVKNYGVNNLSSRQNPAGLLYKLVVKGDKDESCKVTTAPTPVTPEKIFETVVIKQSNLKGWVIEESGGGNTEFLLNGTAPLGTGTLNLVSDAQVTARAGASKTVDVKLVDLEGLSYKTRQNDAIPEGDAAYRIRFDADGDISTTNDVATLIYEPYWQNAMSPDPAPVDPDVWQTWNVDDGHFWVSVPGGSAAFFSTNGVINGAGGPPFFTLPQMQAFYPNAKVTSFGVHIGSYNPLYNIDVDAVVFGTDVKQSTYDFEPETIVPCEYNSEISSQNELCVPPPTECPAGFQQVSESSECTPIPPTITPQPESRSSSGGTRTGSRNTPRSGEVLGASTMQCGMYLFDYMKEGTGNDEFEVKKLQWFLIGQGHVVPVTGVFDAATDAAVKAFQLKYQLEVLTPWFTAGFVPHNNPTGWVYQLTRWKINNIVCPGSEAAPVLIP